MVLPDSNRVSRAPSYSGYSQVHQVFGYETFTLFGVPSQTLLLTLKNPLCESYNPNQQASWFGLFCVRSPLLAKSQMISIPLGTKMFQFPRFAPRRVFVVSNKGVAPFRNLRINACLNTPRSYRFLANVFHRLLLPRYSPCTLSSFLFFSKIYPTGVFTHFTWVLVYFLNPVMSLLKSLTTHLLGDLADRFPQPLPAACIKHASVGFRQTHRNLT